MSMEIKCGRGMEILEVLVCAKVWKGGQLNTQNAVPQSHPFCSVFSATKQSSGIDFILINFKWLHLLLNARAKGMSGLQAVLKDLGKDEVRMVRKACTLQSLFC
jgi:hypothetical protein